MMKRFVNKWTRPEKKKGMTSIEIVLSVLLILIAISGFVDLTNIIRRGTAVSASTAYVSRVVGNQGGIQTKQIKNFSGRYVGSNELYSNIKRTMESSGIPEEDWTVRVYGVTLTPTTNLAVYDYGTSIPITVTVDYEWGFTQNFVPGNIEGTHSSRSSVYTTHKIRDGNYKER